MQGWTWRSRQANGGQAQGHKYWRDWRCAAALGALSVALAIGWGVGCAESPNGTSGASAGATEGAESAQAKPAAAALGGAMAVPTTQPVIDPRADAALKRMSQRLAQSESFQLHSVASMEQRMDSGQVVQFSRDSIVLMSRPDCLWAEVRRGGNTYRIWHQGDQLTVLDVQENQYASLKTPVRVDQVLDFLAEEHGIVVPLDDLMFPDPYKTMTEHVRTGTFVDQQEVEGRTCDHLLFTQDNVNWQIWIDTGEPAVPRRVVITYKDDPERLQFEATLNQWEFDQSIPPGQFAAQLPPKAKQVDIDELTETD